MNRRRVAAVALKEWREIVRDRIFLLLAFLLPALLMLVFGYGISQEVENVAFAVIDEDRSPASRDYARHFIGSRYFAFRGYLADARAAERALAAGTLTVVIVIERDFERRLLAGRPAPVQTLVDGTFLTRARTVLGYVDAINAAASAELRSAWLARRLGLAPDAARAWLEPVRLEVRYLYNQPLRSIWGVAPSLVMFVLILASPLLTALSVVREKETGSIWNVYSSTITRAEFLAGKLAPNVAISFVNALVLWLMATCYFGAPFRGSAAVFAAATMLYVLGTSGLGLLVSLLVRTQQAALIASTVASMVIAMSFSGLITPVASLTGADYVVAHLLPPTYYNDVAQGTFLKGSGLAELWRPLAALALFAAALVALAYALFRKRVRA